MNTYDTVISSVPPRSNDGDAGTNPLCPVAPIDRLVEAYRAYGLIKSRLLSTRDYQIIRGKKCVKKSGFRKLSMAFGLSTQVVREHRLDFDDYFVYEFTVRATAPNGRHTEASASCASNERDFVHIEHDTRSTAQTRACNRAIADLIADTEISDEELETDPSSDDTHATDIEHDDSRFASPIRRSDKPRVRGSSDGITPKQRSLLVKLIESRYQDEQTRSGLFQRLPGLTKDEAREVIKKMIETSCA